MWQHPLAGQAWDRHHDAFSSDIGTSGHRHSMVPDVQLNDQKQPTEDTQYRLGQSQ